MKDKPNNRTLFPQPRERFGEYLIQDLIDEDRTGLLYKALDEANQRLVCVKILSPELTGNGSFVDVLRIQLQALATQKHSGISEVYELAEAAGLHYIAYEWGDGRWLSQQVLTKGRLSIPDATDLIIQCAEVLQAACVKSIFHGNLRPNHIQILQEGGVRIAEIGIVTAARVMFGPKNLSVYLGTARFLAPEMTATGTVDFRADIYSLGLIYYFLIFGIVPFRYEGQKLTAPPESSEDENLADTIKIIDKMTQPNANNRYSEYSLLLADLYNVRVKSITLINVPTPAKSARQTVQNQRIFKVLCALCASGASGVVTVKQENAQRVLYVRNREIVYFHSGNPDEQIWEWLVAKKEIAPDQKPQADSSFERSLNRILAQGFLRIEDFKYRYQELAARVVAEIIKYPSADCGFAPTEIKNGALASIRLSDVLLRMARLSIDSTELQKEIQLETYLHRTGLFEMLVSGFTLNKDELFLVSVSQGGIFTGSTYPPPGTPEEKGLRFLYLLKQIGALEVSASPVPDSEPSREPPLPLEIPATLEPVIAPEAASVRVELQRAPMKIDVERIDREAEKRFALARESFANGKYWEAANLCETALALHEDGRYYWLMGMAYAQHPKFRSKAEDCFHRAINLDPLNDELHIQLAEFYSEQGLHLRAKTHCVMALKIIPDHDKALGILARPEFKSLGPGGCCCEHEPGCNHDHHW